MSIRLAASHDLAPIVDIYNAAIPGRMATADTELVTVDSRRDWLHQRTKERPLWVIEAGGEVAGWLSFESFHHRPAYHGTAEISVYVSPRHQRRGLGLQLLRKAIAEGPGLGLRTLLAMIFAHNPPSLALFEGCGFRRWGHLPGVADMDGIERDTLILGRRVDAT